MAVSPWVCVSTRSSSVARYMNAKAPKASGLYVLSFRRWNFKAIPLEGLRFFSGVAGMME